MALGIYGYHMEDMLGEIYADAGNDFDGSV